MRDTKSSASADDVYNTMGPGITIYVEEEASVNEKTTTGVLMCDFFLIDSSPSRLFEHANEVKTKLVLREKDRDLLKLPATE